MEKEIIINNWEDFRKHIENLKLQGVPIYIEDVNNDELDNPYRVGNKIPNPELFKNLKWAIKEYITVSKNGKA